MEFIFLFAELVIWIDRLFEKSLQRVLPDLERLRADPAAVLDEGPLTIGPARRYGTGVALGLLASGPGLLIALLVFVALVDPPQGPPNRSPAIQATLGALLVGVPLGSIWLVLRWLRGGHLVLHRQGVELRYRRWTVFCPWELFDRDGLPEQQRRDRLRLPIAPAAVPYVVATRRDGYCLPEGQLIRTRQFRLCSPNEAVLIALYEVRLAEIGPLLLHLGRILGPTSKAETWRLTADTSQFRFDGE